MSDEVAAFRAQFERLGVEAVRTQVVNGQYRHNPWLNNAAIDWLAEKNQESSLKDEDSKREQIELARSAADSARLSAEAARTSNRIAMAALIAAIIAIIISAGGIFIPH